MTKLHELTRWSAANRPKRFNTNPLTEGYRRGSRKLPTRIVDAIVEDLQSGEFRTYGEIAVRNGVSTGSISNYSKITGIKLIKKP